MGTPALGEIKIVSFEFAPKGWAMCNGQLLPINQNQALFALLGNKFGGDGVVTFALPDLRGRAPVHMGSSIEIGERIGSEAVTVTLSQLPTHNHFINAYNAAATADTAAGNLWATVTDSSHPLYTKSGQNTTMAAVAISAVGGNQPHENRQPYIVMNYIIALQGIFPSQT